MTFDPQSRREPSVLQEHWTLDPDVTFLNHGSFGACPRSVLDEQQDLRAQLERQPVDFFVRQFTDKLDHARVELATFLGADPDGLAFVPNATTGVNSVLGSIEFTAGDEVIVTDHAYNACSNALNHIAKRCGVVVRLAKLPFPLDDPEQVVSAILAQVRPKTRLALIDHITSATALVLPLERIVSELAAHDVDVLVDGAHAPGMIPLDLNQLGAAYYAGNCHKWICAPKGAGFLWAREDKREATRPSVISHGANSSTEVNSRFRNEFDWIGTIDPTAWLCVPTAIEFMRNLLPGGWPEVMRRNRDQALAAREMLCRQTEQPIPAPDEMIGSIATLWLPDGEPSLSVPLYEDPLQRRLWDNWKIEVPIGCWPAAPKRFLRISAQLYNTAEDYERLGHALGIELARV
ncbi:MAG: isopenicillin-N epimerase [Planctomycetota bacterium]|jgi:isopenicillin-N epimerase